VWIDIDSPPQVQYLLPFKPVFEQLGANVTVTARDVGITYELLERSGARFHRVGGGFGRSTVRKATGNVQRAVGLIRLLLREGRPDISIGNARAAVLAAAALRATSFVILDYEHSHVATYVLARSYVLHPEAIDAKTLRARGFSHDRLIPFTGLKEDISLQAVDLERVEPPSFGEMAPDVVAKVLVRPPAEESHYYREESRTLTLELLRYLSKRRDALVIFSPRHPWQLDDLAGLSWINPPVALTKSIPALSLLKGVDLVISAGGTMVREAGYLGIPAYSTFQSSIGQVDRYLESIGRITMITSPGDFERIRIAPAPRLQPLNLNPNLRSALVGEMIKRAAVPQPAAVH
jgi:predicted glycosyltransferase